MTASEQPGKAQGGFLRANWPKIVSAGFGLAAVAAVTGYVSYGHIKALTLYLGQPAKYADVWPIGVDGMVVVGSVVILTHKRERWLGWVGIGPGVAQSVFANVVAGWSGSQSPSWLTRFGAASWTGMIAIGFAISCFMFERWLVGTIADWREAGKAKSATDGEAAETAPGAATPEPETPAAPPPGPPTMIVPDPDPVLPEMPAAPEPAALTGWPRLPPWNAPAAEEPAATGNGGTPTPSSEAVSPEPPAAPQVSKPAAAPKPQVAKREQQQSGDSRPRTCCAAHRALDSGTKLDREQALAVFTGHRSVHHGEPRFKDLGATSLERIFGMGSRPARDLRDELAAEAGAAPAQHRPGSVTGAEPGLSGAGVAATPGDPGSPSPAQVTVGPGSPSPAPIRAGAGSSPAQPGTGPGSPAPAQPGPAPAPVYPGSAEPGPATPAQPGAGSDPARIDAGSAGSAEPGLDGETEPGQAVLAGSGVAG